MHEQNAGQPPAQSLSGSYHNPNLPPIKEDDGECFSLRGSDSLAHVVSVGPSVLTSFICGMSYHQWVMLWLQKSE